MRIFLCTMFVALKKAMWTRLIDFTPPLFQIFRPSYGPEGGSCCHALHTSRRAWERSHHVKRPSELCLRKSNLCVKVVGLHRYLPCCLFEPGLTIIDVRCFCKEHLWNLLKEFRYVCLETLDKVRVIFILCTQARTLSISGLKSRVLKFSFLSLKMMVKSGLEFIL